jgi:iron complex outermembrane receptor protein
VFKSEIHTSKLSMRRAPAITRSAYLSGASLACLVVLSTGITMSTATQARAQLAAQPGDTTAIQEVVVTARKRAENLQDVPLAITAVTAKELVATGATSLESITQLSPGVTYTSVGAEANAQVIIRGISDTSGGYSTSQNVSTFLDGIYIKNPAAIDLSLGGVERVEIVKGPVSTTYGRNAFMGAINYVTKVPTDSVHIDAAYSVGDHGLNVGEASVSGPIIEGLLKGSIAGTYATYDGYDHDSVTGVYTNGYDKKDLLATLVFTPNSHITITPVFYHGDDSFTQPTTVSYKSNCGTPSSAFTGNFYCGDLDKNEIGPYGADNPGGFATGLNRRVNHLHVDAKFAYDFGTIDVLAGGNSINTDSFTEFDETRFGLPFSTQNFATGAAGPKTLGESFFGDVGSEKDSSIEARYDSPQQNRLRVSFGGYYYYNASKNSNPFGIYAPNVPAGYILDDAFGPAGAFQTTTGKPSLAFNGAKTSAEDKSGFVSGEFDILKNLTLGEELRYLSETEKESGSLGGGNYQSAKFSPVTSRTTLSWKPTKEYNVYFSAANGEKSGGFNTTSVTPADATFQPETDWSYELGVKATLLDHRLIVDADVFHTDIDGLQQLGAPSAIGSAGVPILVVKNYGSVEEDGFELETKYNTDFGLVLGGGLAIQDPRFSGSSFDTSDAGACAVIAFCASKVVSIKAVNGTETIVPAGTAGSTPAINLKGGHLPFAADFTLNLNAEYRHPVELSYVNAYMPQAEWFARADYRYEGKEYGDVSNFNYVTPKNIINLHAGIENSRWSVVLALLNVTNDRTPLGGAYGSASNGTLDAALSSTSFSALPDGRTFSARFAFHY